MCHDTFRHERSPTDSQADYVTEFMAFAERVGAIAFDYLAAGRFDIRIAMHTGNGEHCGCPKR